MAQAHELDIGPLTWVSGEIDQALARAAAAITEAAEDPAQHSRLQFARTHLHQARGALSMVGLDGACQFADALDKLLAGMIEERLPVDAANTTLARRACSTIGNYLSDIVGGSGDQPLRLFALYRELAAANGQGEVSAADMFFPDLERRMPRRKLQGAPRPGTPAGDQRMRGARAALESGLLQWLKNPEDSAGPSTMRDAAIALEALQASPAFHTLWRVAQAFFDSLLHGDLPASTMRIRQLCAGLAKEVRQQSGASHRIPERLMRDLLFEIGQAPARTQAQRDVRQLWNLDAWWAEPGTGVADIPLGPLLRNLRSEINAAKQDWDTFGSSGQAAALQDFDRRIQHIAAESARLGRPALQQLLEGTAGLSRWLLQDPVANSSDTVSIEVATALLLAELGVEGGIADSELSSQSTATIARFDTLMRGEQPAEPSGASLEAARQAHEWDARQQVVREIVTNLGQIEQTLDDFFRNHAKHAPLAQLATPIRQVEGALMLIGGEQAVPLLHRAGETIARLATGDSEPEEQQLTELADTLSTLGFFVSALQHGQVSLDSFLPPEQRSTTPPLTTDFEIDFDDYDPNQEVDLEVHEATELDFAAALEPEHAPPPLPIPQPSAPAPASDEAVDAELLGIFIEEAHDVLGTIHSCLEQLTPHGRQDALVDIRRGFHTLKGSGRMVGLSEFGEAAWAIEQTLNRWLHLESPVTEELHTLLSDAHREFSLWVAQIEGDDGHGRDFSELAARAEHLRNADEDTAGATVAAALPSAPETPSPAEHFGAVTDDTAENLPEPEAPASAAPYFDFGDLPSLELDDLDAIEAPEPPAPEMAESLPAADALLEAFEALPISSEDPFEAQEEPLAPPPDADAPEAPPPSPPASNNTVRLGSSELSRQLFELYLSEAHGHIDVLKEGLRPLRRVPAAPSEKLLRAAHTLSGISGTAHAPPLQDLARALEFAIHRMRDDEALPGGEEIDLLATTTDTLEAMLTEVEQEQLPLPVPELVEQLDATARHPAGEGSAAHPPAFAETEAETDEAELPAAATDDVPPAIAPEAAAEEADEDAPSTVHDDLDEQLLPIFLEEANELMAGLDERLRLWQGDSANPEHAQLTARLLHTLKGSARMAGAMQLGELIHRVESRLETGIERQHDAPRLIEELTAGLDQAAHLVAVLSGTEAPPPKPAVDETSGNQAAAIAIETGGEAQEAAQSSGTLRVRADALGNFINTAGEIGIARTRIDGELRTLRRSLLDLTENVIRLRNQLREVELQAETQMQSRIAQADSQHGEFDPLEMDRYTRLQELTRLMAESVGDVTTVQQQLLRNLDGAELALHSQARFTRDLQQALMQVRMVPFDSLADRLYRVVRQGAKDEGKRVNLDIRGGRIGIDRSVLERMTIAIEHMLRNAVAHGIEATPQRLDAGKNEIGQITLNVSQTGNEIAIELSDDGRGLDYAAIAARAVERGLLAADETPDERQLTNLIFAPGFSTADAVSALAGRGVGMDVVRAEVAALGGRIDVHATLGQGTQFRIYLPLTLAVTQALLVRAAHTTYAIPSTMIAQALELRADAVERVMADGHVEWHGERYAYRYLPALVGDHRARPEIQRFNWVLLLQAGGERIAVHVDSLRGNQEIVVKAAGPQLLRIVGISGATVLGDGEIVLILNPIALASRSDATATPQPAEEGAPQLAPVAAVVQQPTVMVVDDSLTVRKITGRLLEREGYKVITAKDGTDALDQLQDTLPDVILSDIEMPRMDGFDLVRNLRADGRTQNIPVVMITSRLADKHREYAQKLGANEYLGKPYDEDELLRLLRRYTENA